MKLFLCIFSKLSCRIDVGLNSAGGNDSRAESHLLLICEILDSPYLPAGIFSISNRRLVYKIRQIAARETAVTRNDERIKKDVAAELNRNSRVDSSAVKIEVTDGEVTLSGTLPSLSVCMAAVEITENVAGVRSVKNKLKVKVPKPA